MNQESSTLPNLEPMTALEVMQILHPCAGSFVSFWKKEATSFINLGGIESPGAGVLEQFQQVDCYFTINPTFNQRTHRFSDETGLPTGTIPTATSGWPPALPAPGSFSAMRS